jgi:hypothetical protein
MPQDSCIPKPVSNISNRTNSPATEFVPQKVIGANTNQKPIIHNQPEDRRSKKSSTEQTKISPLSFPSVPNQDYENPFHVVDELREKHAVKINGVKKEVFERIAKCNLKGRCPTQKEILKDLKISDENLKKIMQRSCKDGLVITHPERLGNEYQYVLANMQHIVKVKKSCIVSVGAEEEAGRLLMERSMENFFLQVLKNRPNPEFHNISLASELQDKCDYHNLRDWPLPSTKNKAKTFEKRVSRHRSFKIMVYPNGTVNINIAASRQPFEWHCREGWIDFIAICGQIDNEIKNTLSHTEPLKSKIYDWQVLRMHVGYDIPLSNPHGKNNSPPKGSFELTGHFNGCIKVKHLDRIYQIYDKQLPWKGICLRIEEQHAFSSTSSFSSPCQSFNEKPQKNMMTVSELNKSFQPASVEEIIKTVYCIDVNSTLLSPILIIIKYCN